MKKTAAVTVMLARKMGKEELDNKYVMGVVTELNHPEYTYQYEALIQRLQEGRNQ